MNGRIDMGNRTWLPLLVLAAILLYGCGQEPAPATPEAPVITSVTEVMPVAPTSGASAGQGVDPYIGGLSKEELILESEAIVRASLLSVSTSTEASAGSWWRHAGWEALLEFRFRVHEYLKGSGPNEITAVVAEEWVHGTEAEAQAALPALLAAYDRRWDDREAILFLDTDWVGLSSLSAADRFWLGRLELSHDDDYEISRWDDRYSVKSVHEKAWLPATSSPSGTGRGGRAASTDTLFLLEDPKAFEVRGHREPAARVNAARSIEAPTISLSGMKKLIADIEAEASAGGTAAHRECVEEFYQLERINSLIKEEGRLEVRFDHVIMSGEPAGTNIYEEGWGSWVTELPDPMTYANVGSRDWFEGQDPDIVRLETSNFHYRPRSFYSGAFPYRVMYTLHFVSTRPLPAGEYQFFHNNMGAHQVVCNKVPVLSHNTRDHRLTVAAPPRTLHEAFFDPVAIGAAVGADGANGVLKPAAFTVGGASATITSLKWESGVVTMELNPSASLAGHAIDFISLDGSASLTLSFDDATQSGGALTWSVAAQPWNAGDLLMLRIGADATTLTTPTPTPTPLTPSTPTPTPTPTSTATPTPTPTPTPDEQTSMPLGSAGSDPGPSPTIEPYSASQIDDDHFGAAVASLEERIYLSGTIVLARLVSAEGDVLRFRAVEYLKGTGTSEFTVRVPTVGRDTQYDGRDAVLFLAASDGQTRSGRSATSFEFADTTTFDYGGSHDATRYTGDRPGGYAFDARNPVWLPAEPGTSESSTGKTTRSSSSTSTSFITDPGSTVSLDTLRSRIAWVEGGPGVAGYTLCIRGSLAYMRYFRDWEAYHGTPYSKPEFEAKIDSGLARGTEFTDYGTYGSPGYDGYDRVWLTGPDADLFAAKIIDDDTDPTNGFRPAVVTARPLPSGTYRVTNHLQSFAFEPCNYRTAFNYLDWVVTVTPPTGAHSVHEAFFDPVAIGAAVGADGANGVLKPAAFTVGGASATITSLKWESGVVTMELNPSASLAGHAIDFISLDGSVTSTLSFDDATQSGGALTWTVAAQPWNAGDLLMLRIGADATTLTTPTPTPTPPLHPSTPTPTPTPTSTATPTPSPTPTTTEPITVTLTPRVEGSETYVNLTIEWNDPQPCDGQYMVALYSSSDYLVTFMGFHPAPATTSLSSETYMWWDSRFFPDRWAGVSCDPSDWSGRRELGRVSLRAVHPDNN